jgi:hypothetical protein
MAKAKKNGSGSEMVHVGERRYEMLAIEPATLRETVRENIGTDGLDSFDLERITIPTGGELAWRIPGVTQDKYAESFHAIILGWADGRVYWKTGFDEAGGGSPPDCYSDDLRVGHGDPGGACPECPYAQWGSKGDGDGNGNGGQACRHIRRLFVVRPENRLPMTLILPPTSLKPAKQYMVKLTSAGHRHFDVVTQFSLEADKSQTGIKYSKAILRATDFLTPEQAERFAELKRELMPYLAQTSAADLTGGEA